MTPEYITKDTLKETLIDWSCDASYIEVETKWALEEIKNIPAEDVAPVVHGYWIEGEKTYRHNWGSITVHQCNCSQCGYTQESSIWGGGISDSIEKTKYCPNCGARMDGESSV